MYIFTNVIQKIGLRLKTLYTVINGTIFWIFHKFLYSAFYVL